MNTSVASNSNAALREDARQLHRQHRAAAVVVGAVGVDVGSRSRARVWRSRPAGAPRPARRASSTRSAPPMLTRVVVAADVDAARRAARQDRHHVAQIDLPRDAALRRDLVGVEVDLQLLARAAHLVEDPVARRADAARRGVLIGQRVARAEADQLGVERLHAIDRDRGDQRLDARIGGRRRRRVAWARAAGTAPPRPRRRWQERRVSSRMTSGGSPGTADLADDLQPIAAVVHLEEPRALDAPVRLVDRHDQASLERGEEHRMSPVVLP